MGERMRDLIEAEWYNGNLDEKARDRLLAALGSQEPGREGLREKVEALRVPQLIASEPDYPSWYYDGWHAALDQVLALLRDTEEGR